MSILRFFYLVENLHAQELDCYSTVYRGIMPIKDKESVAMSRRSSRLMINWSSGFRPLRVLPPNSI